MTLFGLLIFGVAGVYLLAALTAPWSFHIGGRWTPLLYWSGSGKATYEKRDSSCTFPSFRPLVFPDFVWMGCVPPVV